MEAKKIVLTVFLALLLVVWTFKGIILGMGQAQPGTVMSVAQLLQNPVYDKEVRLYGKTSLLGQSVNTSFRLSSGGRSVTVWYEMMVENDGTVRTSAKMEAFKNGDNVIASGELKTAGKRRRHNTFWATSVKRYKGRPVEGMR